MDIGEFIEEVADYFLKNASYLEELAYSQPLEARETILNDLTEIYTNQKAK